MPFNVEHQILGVPTLWPSFLFLAKQNPHQRAAPDVPNQERPVPLGGGEHHTAVACHSAIKLSAAATTAPSACSGCRSADVGGHRNTRSAMAAVAEHGAGGPRGSDGRAGPGSDVQATHISLPSGFGNGPWARTPTILLTPKSWLPKMHAIELVWRTDC